MHFMGWAGAARACVDNMCQGVSAGVLHMPGSAVQCPKCFSSLLRLLMHTPCTTTAPLLRTRLQAVQDMCMHKMAERLYQGLQQVWGWV